MNNTARPGKAGGTLGALLTGVFADEKINPVLGSMNLMPGLFVEQVKACGVTIAWSLAATLVITLVVNAVIGQRPTAENEELGLDLAEHGYEA